MFRAGVSCIPNPGRTSPLFGVCWPLLSSDSILARLPAARRSSRARLRGAAGLSSDVEISLSSDCAPADALWSCSPIGCTRRSAGIAGRISSRPRIHQPSRRSRMRHHPGCGRCWPGLTDRHATPVSRPTRGPSGRGRQQPSAEQRHLTRRSGRDTKNVDTVFSGGRIRKWCGDLMDLCA